MLVVWLLVKKKSSKNLSGINLWDEDIKGHGQQDKMSAY